MADNEGKRFEEDFKLSINENVLPIRVKDDTSGYAQVYNICDYILYSYPNMFMLELKSCKTPSLPLANISIEQLEGLYGAGLHDGVAGGFLLNYRKYERTFYVSAKDVYEFVEADTRKSIPVSFCEEKGIEVVATKRRVRFRYDVWSLLCQIRSGLYARGE